MGASFAIKSIWLFLLGIVVSVIGLYCFVFRPDMGPNSFTVMLIGLFFTGTGSIYGKKKLREGPPMVSAPAQQKTIFQQPQQTYPGYSPREMPSQPTGMQAQPRAIPAELEGSPEEEFLEVAEETVESEIPVPVKPMKVEKPEIPAKPMARPKEAKIIKIVVCPNCGTENETMDKFCYSCGNRLKPEKRKVRRPRKITPPAKPPAKKPALKHTAKMPSPAVQITPKTVIEPPAKKPVKKAKKRPVKKPVAVPETEKSA